MTTAALARPTLQTPLTVANATAWLGDRAERKLAASTVLRRATGNDLAVRYHATDVVTLHVDGSYTLRTGGWYTPTTKRRIQEYAPVRVYASDGLLWVGRRTPSYEPEGSVLLTEGLRLAADGVPLNPTDATAVLAAKRKLDREVSAYVKGYVQAAVEAGKPPMPGGGDCWACFLREAGNQGGPASAEPMGVDHYRDHFRERYYVPSLAYNALRERGADNPGFVWLMWQHELARGQAPWDLTRALQRFFQRRKPVLLGLIDTVPPLGARSWQSGG